MIPNSSERALIEQHMAALNKFLAPTPMADVDSEAATLVVITKMLLALPAPKQSETSAEARGEAYMASLDDIPTWAVAEAVRCWYRGECRDIGQGARDEYGWAPSPARLRDIANRITWPMRGRIIALNRLLTAEELKVYTDEYRKEMLDKLSVVLREVLKPKAITKSTPPASEHDYGEADAAVYDDCASDRVVEENESYV